MIIFAHSKFKSYENLKIQGVALPKKERNGQEWKSSHHGTHHGELGADTTLTEEFLKMGVDELSVSAGKVLAVRKVIRETRIS